MGELSGWKKGIREEDEVVERAFKKKKGGVDVVERLFGGEGNKIKGRRGKEEERGYSNNYHNHYD